MKKLIKKKKTQLNLISLTKVTYVLFCCFNFWQNVTPGMKLWGVISEVNEKDLVVSLPGGLRGLVRASEATDPLLHDELKGV